MIKKIENLFEKPIPEIKEETKKVEPTGTPLDETISIEEFLKVQLVIGTIEQCHEIDGSDKLYKLHVNCGPLGVRQVLSGVRKHFTPQELIGKQGTFVLNLKPRKMMGIESQGMMLLAETPEKKLTLISPAVPVANGTRLK